MQRTDRTPRLDLKTKLESLGLTFHTVDEEAYWNESAVYSFPESEITVLEDASQDLHNLCREAVEQIIRRGWLSRLFIPEAAHKSIVSSWEEQTPSLYGRFDLSFDGSGDPKLLEYNADTPTSLLESAVIQWHWLQEALPNADQFNFIWEELVAHWSSLGQTIFKSNSTIHFACADWAEDIMTTAVLMDTASEAGLKPKFLFLEQIGWSHRDKAFVDEESQPISNIFKLYPWEFLLRDQFGEYALTTLNKCNWIEPIWKMILSNKGLLPILWELFPDHPNLLPAYFDSPKDLKAYVKKPLLGREGSNITIFSDSKSSQSDGPYAGDNFIYQSYRELPQFNGNYAVVGSWIINDKSCGIGIRESNGPITRDNARYVPHYFLHEQTLG